MMPPALPPATPLSERDPDPDAGRTSMLAARLHGPRDLRVERVPSPGPPSPGQVLLRVKTTGICGSDLHSYQDARIGDTPIEGPFVIGHEFSAVVEAAGPGAADGWHQPLTAGTRVAVDPAQPCGRCELCDQGHPNLCLRLHFCGNYPDGGSLCEWLHMPARSCYPIPDAIDDTHGALIEPLGVAVHAVDLARIRVGDTVSIIGAGAIGLLILQLVRLSGASTVFVADPLPWRLALAERWGALPVPGDDSDAVSVVERETRGRGVDVAIEAAWADHSIEQAAAMARLGGRLVLVGIPGDDRLAMKHSTARRKGLTIRLCRRMKHVHHRALDLMLRGRVELLPLVTHRFPLAQAADAFRLNAAYRDGVVKVMIDC
jgi:L-iditol 2-dehydrogenase